MYRIDQNKKITNNSGLMAILCFDENICCFPSVCEKTVAGNTTAN